MNLRAASRAVSCSSKATHPLSSPPQAAGYSREE
jgi:hypothetical protein